MGRGPIRKGATFEESFDTGNSILKENLGHQGYHAWDTSKEAFSDFNLLFK